jgi:aminoglycoside phosphotransferase (APT) family kinase protein
VWVQRVTCPSLHHDEVSGVASVLHRAGVAVSGKLRAKPLAGGRSNLTFLLYDDHSRWVLRTPPRAGRTPSAHDVAREHRVTSRLIGSAVPVAQPVTLCLDESVLGGPFAVSSFVEGRAFRSRVDLDALNDVQVGGVVDSLLSCLATIHAVDYQAVGLETFGRADGYASRQIRRWSGQWELVGSSELAALARAVMKGLGDYQPRQQRAGIVHGDFRLDNTLIAETPGGGHHLAAVVDWEMSTIGDPVADVALMCAYRNPAFDLVIGEPSSWTSLRLPPPPELAAAYERVGGVALVNWEFHMALAHFKIAVVAAGIDHRFRAGAESVDGLNTAGQAVEPFLEAAFDQVRALT